MCAKAYRAHGGALDVAAYPLACACRALRGSVTRSSRGLWSCPPCRWRRSRTCPSAPRGRDMTKSSRRRPYGAFVALMILFAVTALVVTGWERPAAGVGPGGRRRDPRPAQAGPRLLGIGRPLRRPQLGVRCLRQVPDHARQLAQLGQAVRRAADAPGRPPPTRSWSPRANWRPLTLAQELGPGPLLVVDGRHGPRPGQVV